MRNRLWFLNMILTNMINAFMIVYVLDNLEQLGSIGVLLIMISTSITALIVSRLILGKDFQGQTVEKKKVKWRLVLMFLAISISFLGFFMNNMLVILLGFAFLLPLIIPNLVKAVRGRFK